MELTDAETGSSSNKKYSEIFDEQFPFYLSLGMSVKEYWEGDVALPYFFRQAYQMKQKQQKERENFFCWLQGQYFAEAIAACFSKGSKYPKEPYKLETAKEPQTVEEEREVMQNAAAKFAAFVAAKNAQMRVDKAAKSKSNNQEISASKE